MSGSSAAPILTALQQLQQQMNDMAQVIQVLQAGQAEERKKRLQAEQEAAQGRSKKSQKTQRMSRGENRKLVAAMGKGAASSVDIRKDFDDSADARLAAYVSTNQKTLAQLFRGQFIIHVYKELSLWNADDTLSQVLMTQSIVDAGVVDQDSLSTGDVGTYCDAALRFRYGKGQLPRAIKELTDRVRNKEAWPWLKHKVLRSLVLPAQPAQADVESVRALRDGLSVSDDADEDGTRPRELDAILEMECTVDGEPTSLLAQSKLLGDDDDDETYHFPDGHPLVKAAGAVADEIGGDALTVEQRIHLLALMSAVAINVVNIAEKGGDKLAWHDMPTHTMLATTLLPGIKQWMLDAALCPTKNDDILQLRAATR